MLALSITMSAFALAAQAPAPAATTPAAQAPASAQAPAAPAPTQDVPVVTPEEASKYVGKVVIVKGVVTQIVLSVNLTTHINFGGIYPKQAFTARFFKVNQSLFPGVRDYEGKTVQVKGVVRMYRGKPEIVLEDRAQILPAE